MPPFNKKTAALASQKRWSGEGVDGDVELSVAKKQAGPMELRPRTVGVVPKQGYTEPQRGTMPFSQMGGSLRPGRSLQNAVLQVLHVIRDICGTAMENTRELLVAVFRHPEAQR